MGGSGGGGYMSGSPRPNEESVSSEISIAQANAIMSDVLKRYNARDIDAIRRSIKVLSDCLNSEIDGKVDVRYAGSVAKHTYVDGLSDIDTLVFLKNSEYSSLSPNEALNKFAERIAKRLPQCEVSVGAVAVTVKYKNGKEIQLLPSIKDSKGHYHVKSWNSNSWVKTRADIFVKRLRYVNIQNGGKVIPAIKLVKGILADSTSKVKLSGYHVEALAIDAFANYKGNRDSLSMVKHFFHHSKERIISPMKDASGQSVNVDGYLGNKNSNERKMARDRLQTVERRINNAVKSGSQDKWISLLNV